MSDIQCLHLAIWQLSDCTEHHTRYPRPFLEPSPQFLNHTLDLLKNPSDLINIYHPVSMNPMDRM